MKLILGSSLPWPGIQSQLGCALAIVARGTPEKPPTHARIRRRKPALAARCFAPYPPPASARAFQALRDGGGLARPYGTGAGPRKAQAPGLAALAIPLAFAGKWRVHMKWRIGQQVKKGLSVVRIGDGGCLSLSQLCYSRHQWHCNCHYLA